MRAMILAAGRGTRMRPLTDTIPKPLLPVGGKPLIVWHIQRLVSAGISDIVINHAWLGSQIEQALGDGSQFGARIHYSPEPSGGLETAGGIAQALDFFQNQPFLVINGDIWCNWQPDQAAQLGQSLVTENRLAWLLMADNPPQHPEGDFVLEADGRLIDKPDTANGSNVHPLTFTGIGVYQPVLFRSVQKGAHSRLAPLLRQAMQASLVIGTHHRGQWQDVGTPSRLASLDRHLKTSSTRHSAIEGSHISH